MSVLAAVGLRLEERLQGLSLELEAGSATAVLGPNGAGKSTLIQALAGLLPARGLVQWNGQSL